MPGFDVILAFFFGASFLLGLAPGPDNIFVSCPGRPAWRNGRHHDHPGPDDGTLHPDPGCRGRGGRYFSRHRPWPSICSSSRAAPIFLWLCLAGMALWRGPCFRARQYCLLRLWRAIPARHNHEYHQSQGLHIFFWPFLPQFCDPAKGTMFGQIIFLGLLFILATAIVFSPHPSLAENWPAGSKRASGPRS